MRCNLKFVTVSAILRLQGRFVTGSDAELVSARNSLEEGGIVKAVVDLSAVPYVDSTVLAFIVELHKSLAQPRRATVFWRVRTSASAKFWR